MTSKRYLYFNRTTTPERKTSTYDIMKNEGDGTASYLGVIKWYFPWRRFVFEAAPDTFWDSGCLKEVTEKIDELMEARK